MVQVRSLTHRNQLAEAIGLGLASLRELGITVPAADALSAGLDRQFGYLSVAGGDRAPPGTWPGRRSPTRRCWPRAG